MQAHQSREELHPNPNLSLRRERYRLEMLSPVAARLTKIDRPMSALPDEVTIRPHLFERTFWFIDSVPEW